MLVKTFTGENPDVKKYVFEFTGMRPAIAEAVLYRHGSYEKRTVLCISTQSGCPVGCQFCGTGKAFIRNLTDAEIVAQATHIINAVEDELGLMLEPLDEVSEQLQIMFMSMGEPMLNIDHTVAALRLLHQFYPGAELLLSTVGIDSGPAWGKLLGVSAEIDKVGLQLSVHTTDPQERDALIPYQNKLSLDGLSDWGLVWAEVTGRPVFLNFCIDPFQALDVTGVTKLFPREVFSLTFSVVCRTDGGVKERPYAEAERASINSLHSTFLLKGYDVRHFDPAGQDDIGGGCGQLLHVQKWFKDRKDGYV